MKTTRSNKTIISLEDISIPSFGYELIREDLLQQILGKDAPEILYWSGKRLARTYPLQTIQEIIDFFNKVGWGTLTVKKESKNQFHFELTCPLIVNRIQQNKDSHYKLEAGFLAQQLEAQQGMIAEAFDQVDKKHHHVEIIVRWDNKDII